MQCAYRDVLGEIHHTPEESLVAILRGLGVPIEGPADARQLASSRLRRLHTRPLSPVTVVWDGEAAALLLTLPDEVGAERIVSEIHLEKAETQRREHHTAVLDVVRRREIDGSTFTTRRVPIGTNLPAGYHRVRIEYGSSRAECLLIAAPRMSYRQTGGGGRLWGVFAPLYSLHSERSAGAGSFTDLERLTHFVGALGGGVVGTLPLLASFLDELYQPSPFVPVSRRFWNELYLDLTRIPEVDASETARRIVRDRRFEADLADLRRLGEVDYRRQAALQRRVLEHCARHIHAGDSPRRAELERWLLENPAASDYAAFRAMCESTRANWHTWPEAARAGTLRDGDYDPEARRYHEYVQWLAHDALGEVAHAAEAHGPGLYLDLPVGVHPDGYDVWRNQHLFTSGISVGAPPDPLAPVGQDWGFPALVPDASREEHYRHFRAYVGEHMARAGVLRIDHVMGLHRLFHIPHGKDGTHGTYVRSRVEEIYAVLCLESVRNETIVFGEDLGTVPDDVHPAMERHGFLRSHVVQALAREDISRSLERVPRNVVATVNTHDMAPFASFWSGADTELFGQVGNIPPDRLPAERTARAELRRAMSRVLTGGASDEPLGAEDALRRTLDALAQSDASLLLVTLEDLWLEERFQNVPGTEDQPNWRRKMRFTLETVLADPRVREALARVDALRRGQTPPEPAAREAPAAGAPDSSPSPGDAGAEMAGPAFADELDLPVEIETGPSETLALEEAAAPGRTIEVEPSAVRTRPAPGPVHSGPAPTPGPAPQPESGEPAAAGEPAADSPFSDDDLYLFAEGSHAHLFEKMGAQLTEQDGARGVRFTVWAPGAARVSVFGSFNDWSKESHPLARLGGSGLWTVFVPGVGAGAHYKFHVRSRVGGASGDKADPFAFASELPPKTASVVHDPGLHEWRDEEWMRTRGERQGLERPMSIYEVHLGSWRRVVEEGDRHLTYRELAGALTDYVTKMGYTHVELLPVMEHPFYGSWGYQVTGYYAPTARYGPPEGLVELVDALHRAGIGVILDWVPSHFPTDAHGLGFFDGTHLYEHADPRQGFHPDWKSFIFNYDRGEVVSFLLSNATFWLDRYHIDGIRVDAVASLLYLDYSRKDGEWVPNRHGGRENLAAIDFLKKLNTHVGERFPGTLMIAEESTAWPMVTRPPYLGGLGFHLKWDMGWMHDTLQYMSMDPYFRSHHHHTLTFRAMYAGSENFVLALSHDEVVHGKKSLLSKMPGDWWKQFATLRALYGYMYALPGKKLLFMGGELGQWTEWNHDAQLDWALENEGMHERLQRYVADLNALYRAEPALHEMDCDPRGFAWIDCHDHVGCTLSFLRRDRSGGIVVVICNFSPTPRQDFNIGVPRAGFWHEISNGDDVRYGGSGVVNAHGIGTTDTPSHGQPCSLRVTLPPLGVTFLKAPPPEKDRPDPTSGDAADTGGTHDA